MKKTLLINVLLLIIVSAISAQTIKKERIDEKFMLGLYPNMFFYKEAVSDGSEDYARLFSLELQPFIAYNIYNNLFIGAQGSYNYFASNSFNINNIAEIGLSLRYVLPLKIDKALLRSLKFYIEAACYKTNYVQYNEIVNTYDYKGLSIEEDFVIGNKLDQTKLAFPLGIQIKVFKNLHLDVNWQYNKYLVGGHYSSFAGGVSYYF